MVTATILDNIMHNCIVRSFPDGSCEVLASDRAVFREPGWEDARKWGKAVRGDSEGSHGHEPDPVDSLERAKRRAKRAVSDLALCNEFRWFVTLTLDPGKVDRYDAAAVTRKLNSWLDNQVRRKGLAYVLVSERHKDGAIHFHGFFNDALAVVDSGTLSIGGGKPRRPRSAAQREYWLEQGAHAVYNLPGWTLGFTTAIELYGERRKAVGYVCKYITKAEEKVGGRWYYSGGALKRPEVTYTDVDFDKLSGFRFEVKGLGAQMVKLTLEGGETDGL